MNIPSIYFEYTGENCNHANIEVKTHDPPIGRRDVEIACGNPGCGYIGEYSRTCDRAEVQSVTIKCDSSCGNYIIGYLLENVYPKLKTIYFDRYRGYSSNIKECENLCVDNLICLGSQGGDNGFTFATNIPNLKWLMFDVGDINIIERDLVKVNKTLLQGVMISTNNRYDHYENCQYDNDVKVSSFEYSCCEFLDQEKTWTKSLLTITKVDDNVEEWYVYRRVVNN